MSAGVGAGSGDGNGAGDGNGDSDGETISVEVPALLAGMRADRGVAMVANVSRAEAAHLIGSGRVLVDGKPVTVGRTTLREAPS